MTINIPADRTISPSGGSETVSLSRSGSAWSRGVHSTSDDRISFSSSTLNIQSTLGDLSVSRAAKVAKLAQLVSSGRYTADSAQTAKALVAGADSVEIR